jgi:hypothetical protein
MSGRRLWTHGGLSGRQQKPLAPPRRHARRIVVSTGGHGTDATISNSAPKI